MNSGTALNVLRVFLLSAFVLVALFVIFCLVLSVQAAPAEKQAAPAEKMVKPIVKIGHPYRAELNRKALTPKRKAPSFLYFDGIYLSWRNDVDFGPLRKAKP